MRPLTSFLWFLLAPLLGFVLALYLTLGGEELLLPLGQVEPVLMSVEEKLASIGSSVGFIGVSLEEQQAPMKSRNGAPGVGAKARSRRNCPTRSMRSGSWPNWAPIRTHSLLTWK